MSGVSSKRDPLFLLSLGVLVLLLVAGGGLMLLSEGGSARAVVPARQPSTYYFEGRVQQPPTAGRLAGAQVETVKAWYQAPDRLRLEVGYEDARAGTQPSLYVVEGDTLHNYEPSTNSYQTRPRPESMLKARGHPGMPLGPLPAESLEEYFESLNTGTWGIVGEERLLGRRTQIIERDLRTVSEDSVIRYWIDPAYLFVMRYQSVEKSGTTTWEITQFAYDKPVDKTLFEFEAPRGAREVRPSATPTPAPGGTSSITIGGATISLPAGYLKISYLPPGYAFRSVRQSSSSGSGPARSLIELRFEDGSSPTPGHLIISQTIGSGDVPGNLRTAETFSVNGFDVYVSRSSEGDVLAWKQGAVLVTLTANSIGVDELLRVAGSMK
jgi:outer membrane lipoprotein-sorting protein